MLKILGVTVRTLFAWCLCSLGLCSN